MRTRSLVRIFAAFYTELYDCGSGGWAYVLAGLGELLDLTKGFLFAVLKLSALAVDFAGCSIDHPAILLQLLCTQERGGI